MYSEYSFKKINMTSLEFSKKIRISTLKMIAKAKASHIGSCFSMADILAVLYTQILKVDPSLPTWPQRDRLLISKGHAAAIVYATLAEIGFFPKERLETYCQDGSSLAGHVTHHGVPGVEISSGSLGHGLPIGCGMALAAQRDKNDYKTFVILSDGECDEGSNWEAILFAGHHRLDNLVVIVDYNKIQSFGTVKEVLNLEPFADKWKAFNWAVKEVDGHDHQKLKEAFLSLPFEKGKPSVVIAHTIKGKGVSFMQNDLAWHYKSPSEEQFKKALLELEETKI